VSVTVLNDAVRGRNG